MTITTPPSIDNDVESMPHIIRNLEDAQPGDIASLPDGSAALKMAYSGTPWLLDPWHHQGKPERVTTYMAAQMGYRVDGHRPPRELAAEVSDEAARAHLAHLAEHGWTTPIMQEATGIPAATLRGIIRKGKTCSPQNQEKILRVHADDPVHSARPTRAQRLDDVEWLLDSGVPAPLATERCGYAEPSGALTAARDAGRPDLVARLHVETEPEAED